MVYVTRAFTDVAAVLVGSRVNGEYVLVGRANNPPVRFDIGCMGEKIGKGDVPAGIGSGVLDDMRPLAVFRLIEGIEVSL
jgi:hypothetical protein